jgi:hypothetical protein
MGIWSGIYNRLPISVRRALYPLELKIRGIRQRRLDDIVRRSMSPVLQAVSAREPVIRKHFFYGASAIHPRHLVTWYIFQRDQDLESARQNGLTSDLEVLTRAELISCGYPRNGAKGIYVSFASEEDVQNKTGGNYFAYFK